MFDKLVESTKQKGRRGGRYFAITAGIYSVALCGLGIATVLTFSPVLAEEFSVIAMLPPPLPGSPPPPTIVPKVQAAAVPVVFAPPANPPRVAPPELAHQIPRPVVSGGPYVPGMPPGQGEGSGPGMPGGWGHNDVPPPPTPTPVVKPVATPTPEVKQEGPRKVSEGVLQGSAIRRVKPEYPPMARQVRASGAVQIQVTISEEGRVTDLVVLSGHPLLRSVAVDAARQWLFTPTLLGGVPVKVQGVLTFNFTLNGN
ncbi:MAG: energy transducer TonB [Acidobacteria bacterium]|nr:energy transducer TonB [Acidobacteriota bacterium]